MNIESKAVYTETGDKGKIVIEVRVDGEKYEIVHMSGPKADVKDYYEGNMSMADVRRAWRMKA